MNEYLGHQIGRRLSTLAVLALLICGAASGAARAQTQPIANPNAGSTVPSSPCDMEYYDSLKSRAWLEAQREISQNQNLIFKPDSVLQYTCFNQFLSVLGAKASSMFSDNPAPSGGSLGTQLTNVVGTAVSTYLNTNFNHTMLGGRSDIQYQPSSSSSYNCTMMNEVWKKAKCMNFASGPKDGFFTFAQYASSDPRTLPQACPGSSLWAQEIPKATGRQTVWPKDPVKTFYKEMTECKPDQSISTGIIKSLGVNGRQREEKFCIPPGCTYEASFQGGAQTGTCKAASSGTASQ